MQNTLKVRVAKCAAAAHTQTDAYIIENGLKYSTLVTREADVFLQLKEDLLYTLCYLALILTSLSYHAPKLPRT